MSDKPIIFSAPMVLALLEGRKTQTRRVLKPQPMAGGYYDGALRMEQVYHPDSQDPDTYVRFSADAVGGGAITEEMIKLPYALGDRLYVREAWAPLDACKHNDPGTTALANRGFYRADHFDGLPNDIARWRPSIHMPRWASRLTLTVTDVRAQRLQEISDADARAEGAGLYVPGHGFITESELHTDPGYSNFLAPRMGFEAVWSEIHGSDAWSANPWVCAISFTVHRGNIDQMRAA